MRGHRIFSRFKVVTALLSLMVALTCLWVTPTASYAATGSAGRSTVLINDGWRFDAGTTDFTGWDFPTGVSSGEVTLPHSWEYLNPQFSYIPAMNQKTVTYTRQLDVSAYQGKNLFIKFYGVSRDASVYIDDELIGTHVGGYSAFVFNLTDAVRGKSSVTLKVEVTNVSTDSIPINVDYTQ